MESKLQEYEQEIQKLHEIVDADQVHIRNLDAIITMQQQKIELYKSSTVSRLAAPIRWLQRLKNKITGKEPQIYVDESQKIKELEEYIEYVIDIPDIGPTNLEHVKKQGTSVENKDIDDKVKYLAFYLPQFHSFPENDEWWGKGFTEWTNVTKAVPQFKGHYQPRLAGELGNYDLSNKETIKKQIEMAKFYGIYGFAIYYYWFDGVCLMDTPLKLILENDELDIPFCLCWANENWSRRWDGKADDILIEQKYDEKFPEKFIRDVVPYFSDKRYIKINGKPVLLIYNVNEIPNLAFVVRQWREYCRKNGIGEIELWAVDFALQDEKKRAEFDGLVEFPPHSVYFYNRKNITNDLTVMNPDFQGEIYDYSQIVEKKEYLKNNDKKLYKGIFLGWDNSARKKDFPTIYHNYSPALFKEWLQDITNLTRKNKEPDHRFVFINAWNEWAEGTYLEPDRKYGYAALEAVREVLEENNNRRIIYVSHDACFNGAQMLSVNIIKQLSEIFRYDVYVVLLKSGELYSDFEKYAKRIICIEDLDTDEDFKNWIVATGAKKALCNTVLSGQVIDILDQLNICCVSMIHEMEKVVKEYKSEQSLHKIIKHAKKIVFASEYVSESVSKIEQIPENKKVIMPQGMYYRNPYLECKDDIRMKIREKYNISKESKIVLGVGFGDYRKGIDLFIESACCVCEKNRNVVYMWVGNIEPRMEEIIYDKVKDSEYRKQIILVGKQSDPMLYYAAADIFLLTSREDPFPTVVMEAMDAGLPVIAFNGGGGYVENITSATGALVPMENVNALSDEVEHFLNKMDLKTMSKDIHEYVDKKFNFIGYIYDLLELVGDKYYKVSVVVPNYNYAHYLKERLDSVLGQTYPIYEILVLDDCSSDNSVQVIDSYVREHNLQMKKIVNEKNSGNVFNQWGKGIELASGDYVWIAEADDLSEKDFVKKVIEKMTEEEDVLMGYSQSTMMNSDGCITSPNYFIYTDDVDNEIWKADYIIDAKRELTEHMSIKNTIPNVSAVIFKKDDYSKYIEQAKKYNVAGDWRFYVSILEKGGKIAYVSESLNHHRRHDNSVTTDLNAKKHFEEICEMQDSVMRELDMKVPIEKVYKYREEVKNYLGV